jgi:hypothetical protein
MSDVVIAPPEPSFADYVRTENAREQAGDSPSPVAESVPVAGEPSTTPVSASENEQASTPPPEPDYKTEAEANRNPDGTFKPKNKKVSNTGEWARNARLTAELAQERAARAAAQEELQRLRTPAAAVQPASEPASSPQGQPWDDPRDPRPTLEMMINAGVPDPYDAKADALVDWSERNRERRAQYLEQEAARHEAQTEVTARVQSFTAEHPDYQEKLAAIEHIKFDRLVGQALAEDEQGPAVAYFLAQHPDEAQRIALETPVAQVKEIGKLLSRMTSAPSGSEARAVSTSRAKPLIKPVSGSPVAPESRPPDELPFGSRYIREMNAQERKAREAMRGA